VGDAGTIVHYDGTTWSAMTSPPSDHLYGVWGSSSNDVFAVGRYGLILHYDGADWTEMSSGMYEHLQGVWGSASTDVFAVGGTIYHYDGSAWSAQDCYDGAACSAMDSGTGASLHGVWGSSGSDVFAVGDHGGWPTILHYDGASWSEIGSGYWSEPLSDVWGISGSDVFAVGGTILHYDGTGWSEMTSGTTQHLGGVWGTRGGDVFAVGAGGTILHYEIPPLGLSTKAVNKPATLPGEPLTYTLSLHNGWAIDITNVRVTDTLPISLTYTADSLSATSGSHGYSSGVITWTGSVSASTAVTLTFGATVTETAPVGASIANAAIISGGGEIITRTATVHVVTRVYLPLVLKGGG
jgi:uncharacterized repeat protein (TIGR01451 family)